MEPLEESITVRLKLKALGAVVRPTDEIPLDALEAYVMQESERLRVLSSPEAARWRRARGL